MDLGFTRLDAARADPTPMPLDYRRLIASLSALQAAGHTAGVEARLTACTFTGGQPIAALVELYTAGPDWAVAAAWLAGCFHPETATKAGRPPPECR